MKISSQTLSLLKSFAGINPNLVIKPGNVIVTQNASSTVGAKAVVEEEFPTEAAIYDLGQLLNLLSISKESSDVEFKDNHLLIRSPSGGVLRYYYAEMAIMKQPRTDEPDFSEVFKFVLESSEMSVIQKTASVVGATMITLESKDGQVTLLVNSPNIQSSNSYSKVVGESSDKFMVRMAIDKFRPLIDDTYEFVVGKISNPRNGAVIPAFRLNSTTKNLRYLIAAEKDARF